MKADDLAFLTIAELSQLILKKEITPVDVVDATLRRIEQLNPSLNAFITILEEARGEARHLEEELVKGEPRSSLHGVPVSVKDIIDTQGVRTTCGSKILFDNVPDHDATVVRKLREAGALLIGKTNLHEFAFGVTSNNPHFGPVRNPWDPERIPGGSSGGSGAAVAAGLGFASIGTDTRGSIRIPAAACGIVGLKPTYGLVSTSGVTPLSWSLDHVGPLTRSVEDAAIMLQAIAGHDQEDPASAARPLSDYRAAAQKSAKGLRIGICSEYFFDRIDPEIERALGAAAEVFRKAGLETRETILTHIREALKASTDLQRPEATAYHQDYLCTRAEEYGAEVRRKLEMGWSISAVDYMNAQWIRQLLKEDFTQAFFEVDCILAPTLPGFPPRIGEECVTISGEREEVGGAYARLNAPQNMTGLPALSLACGFGSSGLPIAMQLIAGPFKEEVLMTIGAEYQRLTDWHMRRPKLERNLKDY